MSPGIPEAVVGQKESIVSWEYSLATHIWVFNVGRGSAAFVRTGLNQGFILDMGCSSEFSPAAFLNKHIVPKLDKYQDCWIAQAILSHPHKDHIEECSYLQNGTLHPKLLTCPNDKTFEEALNWKRIKNPAGSEKLVETYRSLYGGRRPPLQTIQFNSRRTIPNLEYGIFYIQPPQAERLHTDDNQYGNACSIMFYLRHGNHSILFPGDMTPEGMEHILEERKGVEKRYSVLDSGETRTRPTWHEKTSDQPSLKALLQRGLSVLMAPHHGLESCYSDALFASIRGGKPQITIISERRHVNENDGCVHKMYQSGNGAIGLPVEIDGEIDYGRKSMSTVNGHHILIVFEGTGAPKLYAHRNPERLLARAGSLSKGAVA